MERQSLQDRLVLILGLILMLVPFVMRYVLPIGVPQFVIITTFVGTGMAVVVLGVIGAIIDTIWEEWVTSGLGLWLVGMPWLIGFQDVAVLMWSALVCGAILFVLGALSLRDSIGTSRA